jgi:hypothetical protein
MQDVLGHDIPVGIVTHCGLDDSGLEPMWGEENSSPPCQSTPAVGPTQPLLHCKPGLFLEVKRLGCSINNQLTASIDVENGLSYSTTVLALTCYGVIFIRHVII